MKRILFLTSAMLFTVFAGFAQTKVEALASAKGPVIEHRVSSGESLYALARKYNLKVGELAKANGFDLNRGLKIGETLKVPLLAGNFNQKTKKGVPVYYSVGSGEGLLNVSKKFNKIPAKTLRDWNGLKADALKKNQSIIVGYLTGVQGFSAPNSSKKDVAQKEEKPKPKKEEAVKKEEKKPEKIAEEKLIAKQETEQAAKASAAEPVDKTGYFKKAFETSSNPALLANRTLMSGIFKTNAGLAEHKYYMLMDGIAPGTIVRVSNPQNGKIVYAKVLGSMKEVKYSENLNMRISEAAAAAMDLGTMEQFVVNVAY